MAKPSTPVLDTGNSLASGLVAAFVMSEGTGTSAADFSGNGNSLTLTDGTMWSTGPNGPILVFDGGHGTDVSIGIVLGSTYTIAYRLRPDTGNGSYGNLGSSPSSSTGNWFLGSSNKITNYWGGDHPNNTALTIGSWYDYGITNDGSTASYYLNGSADGSSAISGQTYTLAHIGADNGVTGTAEPFHGAFEYFYVWNRVLSSTELATLASDPYAMFQASSGIHATVNSTIAAVTSAATGTVKVTGSVSSTIAPVTLATTVHIPVTGTLNDTIGPVTLSSTSGVAVSAALNGTIGAVTLNATAIIGAAPAVLSLNSTISPVTLSSAGTVKVSASLGSTIGPVVSSSTATVAVHGTVSSTIGPVTSASAAAVQVSGSVNSTIDPVTSSATSEVLVSASLGSILGPVVSSATAEVDVHGQVNSTIGAVTLSSTLSLAALGPIHATVNSTIGPVTLFAIAVNPGTVQHDRFYLQIPKFNIDNPPGNVSAEMYVVEKLREMQQWFDALTEAAIQTSNTAPLNPRYGTIRYATGDWATALGGVGLYIYKEGGWTHIA